MISLSRVIKSSFATTNLDEKRVIGIQNLKLSRDNHENNEADFNNLHLEAEAIIQEAERKAEQILLSAQSDLDNTLIEIENKRMQWDTERQHLQTLAKEEGFTIGLQEGRKEGLEQYKNHIAEARDIINLSQKEYHSLIDYSEETILKIGIKVAEKILSKQLDEKAEDFLLIVRKAIKEVSEYSQIQIYVHPRYFELLLNQKEELKNLYNKDTDISIFPNEDLPETGCMIESSFGRIDASVDSQLIEIKNKLLSLLAGD